MATVAVADDDDNQDKLCDMCQREDTSSQATTWCKDCSDALCDQCKGFHRRMKLAAKHRTVPINDVSGEEIAASKLDIDTKCDLHPDKFLELYCDDHNQFCCLMCAVTSHKECSTVVSLDGIARRSKEDEKQRTTDFSKIASYALKLVDEKKTKLTELEKEKTSLLSQAFNLTNITKQKLDTLYAEFEKTVHKKYDETKQAHKKTLECLQDFHGNVKKCYSCVKLLQHVPQHQSIIMMEKMRQDVEKRSKEMTEILKKDTNVNIILNPDSTMTLIMSGLSKLGELKEEVKPITSTKDTEAIKGIIKSLHVGLLIATPAQSPVLTAKQDLLTAKVNLVRVVTRADLNLKGNTDFFDGTFVDDKNCLFTDYMNKRLVLLNEKLKVKLVIKVEETPTGINLSQDKTGVYVVCNRNTVLMYSLQGENTVTRRISIEPEAWGLGVRGNTIITGHADGVVQYDLQGNTTNTVSTQGWVYRIAVSNDGTRFYHRDRDQICCRDVNTCTEIFKYNNKDVSDPHGICVDYNDNVYTVGYTSGNVHQMSHDGRRHRVLVEKLNNIVKPHAIVFHPTRPMFIVTSHNEYTVMEKYEFL